MTLLADISDAAPLIAYTIFTLLGVGGLVGVGIWLWELRR